MLRYSIGPVFSASLSLQACVFHFPNCEYTLSLSLWQEKRGWLTGSHGVFLPAFLNCKGGYIWRCHCLVFSLGRRETGWL
jgi:hypothetical protein